MAEWVLTFLKLDARETGPIITLRERLTALPGWFWAAADMRSLLAPGHSHGGSAVEVAEPAGHNHAAHDHGPVVEPGHEPTLDLRCAPPHICCYFAYVPIYRLNG